MEWFSNNKNKLLDAAYDGNLKEVKHLLEKKSVPLKSCRDVIGSTPLHFAAFRGHVDVVQYLIERHKMKPSSKNDKGQTPLDLARENNHQGVVAYLTALPAEPAARQRTPSSNHSVASGGGGGGGGNNSVAHTVVANSVTSGNTYRTTVSKPPSRIGIGAAAPSPPNRKNEEILLREAASLGNLVEVFTILKRGVVSINCQDAFGSTPLHVACAEGRLNIVQLLVEQHANLSICNRMGQTPLDVARLRNRSDIVDFLTACSYNLVHRQAAGPPLPPPHHHAHMNGAAAAAAAAPPHSPPFGAAAAVGDETPIVSAYIVGENPLPENLTYKDQGRELGDVLRGGHRTRTAAAAVAQPIGTATAAAAAAPAAATPLVGGMNSNPNNNNSSNHSSSDAARVTTTNSFSGSTQSTIADRIERMESQIRIAPDPSLSAIQRVATLEENLFGEVQKGGIRKRIENLEAELFDS